MKVKIKYVGKYPTASINYPSKVEFVRGELVEVEQGFYDAVLKDDPEYEQIGGSIKDEYKGKKIKE